MTMRCDPLSIIALVLMLTSPWTARGEVVLLDAESDQELQAWGQKSTSKLASLSGRFASRGTHSLRFSVPALAPGEAPAKGQRGPTVGIPFKKPPVTDWSAYERLVLDVVNAGEVAAPLRLTVNTTVGKTDHDYPIPPGRWVRVVLPVALMNPEQTDIKRVTSVRVTGYKIDRPWEVFLDNMTLLAPGEAPPEAPDAFRREMAGRLCAEADRAEHAFSGYRAGLADRREGQVADWAAETALAELRKTRRLLERVVHLSSPSATTDELAAQNERLDRAARTLDRVPSIVAWARACTTAGTLRDRDVLVGRATSMSKILPRENPLELAPAKELEISAARGETESAQIVVLPLRHGLRRVSARVDGDLRSTEGHALSTEHIDCDVMGYIETRNHPPYGVSFIGWWPDPILDFLGPVAVARGDAQSFWIRVRASKDQSPGLYRGTVTVNGRGMGDVSIPFSVRVRNFAVPAVSPLPTAITTGPPMSPFSRILENLAATPEWNATLKYKWADFLADYYIGYDHLYRFSEPDFEVIDHLNRQGRLGAFNLGQFQVGKTPEGKANPDELQKMLAWTGEAYRKTKDRGLIDHAYIYGFDEVKEVWFDTVEQTAAAVKKAMPGVMVMTSAKDYDFGRKGWLRSIDAWCPNTQDFDPAKVEEARARGDQVWWYICTGPRHPYANIFVEYPAIEARLLMGAMTAKYRPDGFLYYQTTIWKSREPIRTGPFTHWEALSYRTYHGDGSWVCMREGGLPVPTVRLENFRDGLEDYAYVRVLEEAIRIKEAKGDALAESERQWLSAARAALETPNELVASQTEYTRDPAVLYSWREKLAALIEESGVGPIDLWKDGFKLLGASGAGSNDRQ